MHWLLNKRNTEANGHRQLNENLIKLGVAHTFVDVIPFTTSLIGVDLNAITDTIFPFGSFTMARVLRDVVNCSKAVFMSDNISFDSLLLHWRDYLLNDDAIVTQFADAVPLGAEFFCRPNEDSKAFTAGIWTREDFLEYQAKVSKYGLKVVVATLKPIQAEYRLFIADNKVIAKSMYRIGGEPKLSSDVDEYIVEFGEHVASIWSPERLYAMDIVISNGEPKVLEVNGVHASGLYAVDTQKFIEGVESLNL